MAVYVKKSISRTGGGGSGREGYIPNHAKSSSSAYADDKNYKSRVNYEPKDFWDWYVNYSNPFTVTGNVIKDSIETGTKNATRNHNSGSGVRDLFKDVASLSVSGSRGRTGSGSGSGLSSGSSPIPSSVPDYLNADLARHYGMDAVTAYSEALANTSHQREVKDLQAAGLNPVLSTRYGGASGVSGASVYAPAPEEVSASSGAVNAKEASVLANLASGVVGLVTGSSAKSNATKDIINSLGNILSSFSSSRE